MSLDSILNKPVVVLTAEEEMSEISKGFFLRPLLFLPDMSNGWIGTGVSLGVHSCFFFRPLFFFLLESSKGLSFMKPSPRLRSGFSLFVVISAQRKHLQLGLKRKFLFSHFAKMVCENIQNDKKVWEK
jgi:hypothetical protein